MILGSTSITCMKFRKKYVWVLFTVLIFTTLITILFTRQQHVLIANHPPLKIGLIDGKVTSSKFAVKHVEITTGGKNSETHANVVLSQIGDIKKRDQVWNYSVTQPDGTVEMHDFLIALKQVKDMHLDVLNVSIGFPVEDHKVTSVLRDIEKDGTIIVASAGDDGHGYPDFPANLPGIISVGSINSNREISIFSPNEGVSAYSIGEKILYNGHGYSGTSFAAPKITSLVLKDLRAHESHDWIMNHYKGGLLDYE